jgi:hypothetical protein
MASARSSCPSKGGPCAATTRGSRLALEIAPPAGESNSFTMGPNHPSCTHTYNPVTHWNSVGNSSSPGGIFENAKTGRALDSRAPVSG